MPTLKELIPKYNVKFIIFVFILLSLPLIVLGLKNENAINFLSTILGTIGISLFIYFVFVFFNKINILLAKVITILLIFFFFLIRITLVFTFDFSGKGFTSEFFAHFGLKSFLVGFDEYKLVFISAIVIGLIVVFFLSRILNKQFRLSLLALLLIPLISYALIKPNFNSVPELNLYTAFSRYNLVVEDLREKSVIRSESAKILKPLRNTLEVPVDKDLVTAKAPEKPKNVIIIYLESFSDMLTENPDYPGLTPNLDRLKNQYLSFKNNYSSGYVTIEGIANSQCGTLLNMDNGNNSLTSANGRLPNLPCLGDILKQASYKQVFYGGAELDFAGKGAFLSEHGYDEVIGIRGWLLKGFKNKNTWGLSDSDLFNEAFKKILELKQQSQPFNFSLLTLGTHIPGYTYEGCTKYSGSSQESKFLDAIHCTDFLLGQFINQLNNHNILSDTVVYIQGDHAIFPTHDMKNLFSKKHDDKRVVNIIIDNSNKHLTVDFKKPTTSLNMVANILDLLSIQHNVDFILANSDFGKKTSEIQQIITRYYDYYDNKTIKGYPQKESCSVDSNLSIPFDYCDKSLALKTLYQLIASYSAQQVEQNICEYGASISIEELSNQINVQWGEKSLSDQFYYEGFTFDDTKLGFYLLLLDQNDNVLSQMFYTDTINELRKLNNEVTKENARYLLFSNLSSEKLESLKLTSLSKTFSKNKIQYAEVTNGKITSLFDKTYNVQNLAFLPESCENKIKLLPKVKPVFKSLSSCQIIKWGPKHTILGNKFQEQPDGTSAYWLETDCTLKDVVFRVNGKNLHTVVRLPIITSAIDDAIYLNEPGLYNLDLYHPASKTSLKIGDFTVFPNDKEPLIVPVKDETKPPFFIAHAGGGYKNQAYMNSIESLNHNYTLGHRVFELDFNWTNDKELVAIHDWGETYTRLFNQHTNLAPSLDEFNGLKMNYEQTQINLSNLDLWLSSHVDAYIVTDIRGRNVEALKLMTKQMKNALKQIIPQMYHPSNYKSIMEIGYKNIIFTLYATKLSADQIIDFTKINPLYAVTINPSKEDFSKIIKSLSKSNVFTYVHTFNTIAEVKHYLSQGVSGVYTDFLYLDDSNNAIKQK